MFKLKNCSFRIFLFLLGVFVFVPLSSAQDANENLVQNGSFETIYANYYPSYWKNTEGVFGKARYKVAATPENTANAGTALYVNIVRNPLQGKHTLYQSGIELAPSQKYMLSFKIANNTGAKITVKLYDKSTKDSILSTPQTFSVPNTLEMQAVSFVSPAGSRPIISDLLFQFEGDSDSTYIMDDVVIQPVSEPASEVQNSEIRSPFHSSSDPSSLTQDLDTCTIYVSGSNGSDTGTGTESMPLKTISAGIRLLGPAKKTLCVEPGVYSEVLSLQGLRGTVSEPYILKSTSSASVTISGKGMTMPVSNCLDTAETITAACLRVPLVGIKNVEHVVLENFIVRESSGVGIHVVDSASVNMQNTALRSNSSFGLLVTGMTNGVSMHNSEISDNFKVATIKQIPQGAGISVYSTNKDKSSVGFTLSGSKIYDNIGDGIFLGTNSNTGQITYNEIFNNTKSNISILNSQKNTIKGNYLYCNSLKEKLSSQIKQNEPSEFSPNVLISSAKLAFSDTGSADNTIANNILYGCTNSMIFGSTSVPISQNNILSNTFAQYNVDAAISANTSPLLFTNNLIKNNLFLQQEHVENMRFFNAFSAENTFDRNLGLNATRSAQTQNSGFEVFNEVFAVPESSISRVAPQVFMPKKDTRSIDYGENLSTLVRDDFFKKQRKGNPDAGAIEFAADQVLGTSVKSDTSVSSINSSECTMYVSKAGNNTTGTSLDNAFQTIQKGFDNISAGGVLCIKGDTYTEALTFAKKGSSNSKIKIGSFSGGGAVIITAGTEKLPHAPCAELDSLGDKKSRSEKLAADCMSKALLKIQDSEYVLLEGITVKDSYGVGILVNGSKNIELASIEILSNKLAGLTLTNTEDVVINKSKIAQNIQYRKENGNVSSSGVLVNPNVSKIKVKDTIFFKNFGEGLLINNVHDIEIHDSAFWDNADTNIELKSSEKIVINRSLVFCTQDGLAYLRDALGASLDYAVGLSYFGVKSRDGTSNTIVNSIFQNCKTNAIFNADSDRFIKNLSVYNNSFVNAKTNQDNKNNSRNVLLLGTRFPGLKFKNNIIIQKDDSIRTIVGFKPSYDFKANILFPNNIRTLAAPAFTTADPKLEDPFDDISASSLSVDGIKLKSGSPAQNAADGTIDSEYLSVDYSKGNRSNIDIGALESVHSISDNDDNDDDDSGDNGNGDGNGDGDGDSNDDNNNDENNSDEDCDYYWCDDYDYDYDYDDYDYDYGDGSDESGYETYDEYSDFYYDFEYDDGTTAQFGLMEPEGSGEVLKNGSFDLSKEQNGLPAGWFIKTGIDGAVKIRLVPNDNDALAGQSLNISLKKLPSVGKVQLFQSNLTLKADTKYKLSFAAKSNYGSNLEVTLNSGVFPYNHLTLHSYNVDLKPDWREYSGYVKFGSLPEGTSVSRLVFSFDGALEDEYFIDKVSLIEVIEEVQPTPEEPYVDPSEYDDNYDPYSEIYEQEYITKSPRSRHLLNTIALVTDF